MRESRLELSVGESVCIDGQILTVIEITGDEVTFRIDFAEGEETAELFCAASLDKPFAPR